MPISQPNSIGARGRFQRGAPSTHATTSPAPNNQASALAVAANANAAPAQKPLRGRSQIPRRTSAIPNGSAIPATSLKIETGDRAANAPAESATGRPQ